MGWKQKQILKAILVIFVIAISVASFWHSGINLGLDLAGGTHVVLEAQDTGSREVDAQTMTALNRIIERRVNQLGLSEPRIQRSGDRRLIVELPAVDNPDRAIEVIGRTAQLTFRDDDGEVLMTGEHLVDARSEYDQMYRNPVINFQLDDVGARRFQQITQAMIGEPMQIYLDDEWLYTGTVESAISDRGQIRGFGSLEEAEEIAILLREGALPVPLSIEESRTVGPTLGQVSIDQSLRAGALGLLFVGIAMVALYKLPGLIATLTLGIYGMLVIGLLAGLQAVLTLPGIAGLILSIGMAVDANIIIFERIKEELRFGKTLRASVESGFRRAMTAIIDANITTLITALILAYFTVGTVRGFAVTLIIGIFASMFCALIITRILIDFAYDFKVLKGGHNFVGARR